MLDVVQEELDFVPDSSRNQQEWEEIQEDWTAPASSSLIRPMVYERREFEASCEGRSFPFCRMPARSERHIGLDQGVKNFAIAVVDKRDDEFPKLQALELHDLHLSSSFKATDVVLKLAEDTNLLAWMQVDDEERDEGRFKLPHVDRVFVHVEQMSKNNKHAKQFCEEMGRELQRRALDEDRCVIKMSSPHLHRASGPTFR